MNRVRRIDAPYMVNFDGLFYGSADEPQVAFCRLKNPASPGLGTDMFFAGRALVRQGVYERNAPEQWKQDARALLCQGADLPLAGYLAYEFGFQYEPEPWAGLPVEDGQCMFRFMELPCWYEADHDKQSAVVCVAAGTSRDTAENFTRLVCDAAAIGARGRGGDNAVVREPERFSDDAVAAFGEFTREEYVHAVGQILEDIRAGRYYELNFTQRFEAASIVHPAMLFCRLMDRLKPAYGFYGRFDGEHIVSASPELFLHKKGAVIQTCPIKGSFSQSPGESESDRVKLEAEHIMVVDLARNDLGRISDQVWVSVAELLKEKQFGAISHLESRIVGKTSAGLDRVLAATAPAASITGMPKVMAVQSIAQYERSARGFYTGNCGMVWPDGDFQFNVAIRTLRAVRDGAAGKWRYVMGAGGAVVADSDPVEEYRECLAKVRPLLEAVAGG